MKKTLGVTLGGALLVGLTGTTAQANENPFALQELSSGYQLNQANLATATTVEIAKEKEGKCGEAKCGEGKCGTKK